MQLCQHASLQLCISASLHICISASRQLWITIGNLLSILREGSPSRGSPIPIGHDKNISNHITIRNNEKTCIWIRMLFALKLAVYPNVNSSECSWEHHKTIQHNSCPLQIHFIIWTNTFCSWDKYITKQCKMQRTQRRYLFKYCLLAPAIAYSTNLKVT